MIDEQEGNFCIKITRDKSVISQLREKCFVTDCKLRGSSCLDKSYIKSYIIINKRIQKNCTRV